eukprot:15474770-Alexandrium_andersonii.AAC.1
MDCLGSLHREVSKVQSAIRPRSASAAIRLNPQSAMRNMQTRFMRSKPELRGPQGGLKLVPPNSRGVRSAPLFAQIPNLPTNAG